MLTERKDFESAFSRLFNLCFELYSWGGEEQNLLGRQTEHIWFSSIDLETEKKWTSLWRHNVIAILWEPVLYPHHLCAEKGWRQQEPLRTLVFRLASFRVRMLNEAELPQKCDESVNFNELGLRGIIFSDFSLHYVLTCGDFVGLTFY